MIDRHRFTLGKARITANMLSSQCCLNDSPNVKIYEELQIKT